MTKSGDDISKFPKDAIPALIRKLNAEADHSDAEAQIARAQAVAAEIGQRDLERKEVGYLSGN